MYIFVKAVITSLITKEEERRKVVHLTPLSIAKIL
jgi:dolichol kinase